MVLWLMNAIWFQVVGAYVTALLPFGLTFHRFASIQISAFVVVFLSRSCTALFECILLNLFLFIMYCTARCLSAATVW